MIAEAEEELDAELSTFAEKTLTKLSGGTVQALRS